MSSPELLETIFQDIFQAVFDTNGVTQYGEMPDPEIPGFRQTADLYMEKVFDYMKVIPLPIYNSLEGVEPEINEIYKDLVKFTLSFFIATIRGIALRHVNNPQADQTSYIDTQFEYTKKLIDDLYSFQEQLSKGGIKKFLEQLKDKLSNISEIQSIDTPQAMLDALDNLYGPSGIEAERKRRVEVERQRQNAAALNAERRRRDASEIAELTKKALDLIKQIQNLDRANEGSKENVQQMIANLNEIAASKRGIKSVAPIIDKYESYLNDIRILQQTTDIPQNIQPDYNDTKESITGKVYELEKLLEKKKSTGWQGIFQRLVNFKEDLQGAVRIFVRVRGGGVANTNIGLPGSEVLEGNKKLTYYGDTYPTNGAFYNIYNMDDTNQKIFETLKSLFNQIKDGYHVAMFGYGYSGSGKTFTLVGQRDGTFLNKEKTIKCENKSCYGIAIKAINFFKENNCTIEVFEAYELYNDGVSILRNIKFPTLGAIDRYIDVKNFFNTSDNYSPSYSITDPSKFYLCFEKLEGARVAAGRIRATINNPVSSRSHLFITFKITYNGQDGFLTLCDMGGREDPFDILLNSYIDINSGELSTSGKNLVTAAGYTGGNIQNFLEMFGTTREWDSSVKTYADVEKKYTASFQSGRIKNKEVGVKTVVSIVKTAMEGFYINETINHLTTYFRKLNNVITTPDIFTGRITGYKPELVFNSYENDNTQMVNRLNHLKNLVSDETKPTKFVMFACIRPESDEKFKGFNRKTLEFASQVASTTV